MLLLEKADGIDFGVAAGCAAANPGIRELADLQKIVQYELLVPVKSTPESKGTGERVLIMT